MIGHSVDRLGWLNVSPPALEIMLQLVCNPSSMGFPKGIDQVVPKALRHQFGSLIDFLRAPARSWLLRLIQLCSNVTNIYIRDPIQYKSLNRKQQS